MRRSYSYTAFGLTIQSDIPLPLTEIDGKKDGFHLQIRKGRIPKLFQNSEDGRLYTQLENGRFLCRIPNVANFLIDPLQEILVDARANADLESIRLFLLGSAMGVVLHHQQGLVLHGNAISHKDEALIFSGPSGIGKSTLATAAVYAGYKILSDDIAMIRFPAESSPKVSPGYPQLKLWESTLKAFEISSQKLKSIYNRIDKFNLPIPRSFDARTLPVRNIFTLKVEDRNDLRFQRLTGRNAFLALHSNTYRIEFLNQIGDRRVHFERCGDLLKRTAIYELCRPQVGYDPIKMIDECINFRENKTDESLDGDHTPQTQSSRTL